MQLRFYPLCTSREQHFLKPKLHLFVTSLYVHAPIFHFFPKGVRTSLEYTPLFFLSTDRKSFTFKLFFNIARTIPRGLHLSFAPLKFHAFRTFAEKGASGQAEPPQTKQWPISSPVSPTSLTSATISRVPCRTPNESGEVEVFINGFNEKCSPVSCFRSCVRRFTQRYERFFLQQRTSEKISARRSRSLRDTDDFQWKERCWTLRELIRPFDFNFGQRRIVLCFQLDSFCFKTKVHSKKSLRLWLDLLSRKF